MFTVRDQFFMNVVVLTEFLELLLHRVLLVLVFLVFLVFLTLFFVFAVFHQIMRQVWTLQNHKHTQIDD